jgi:hypothetical protein
VNRVKKDSTDSRLPGVRVCKKYIFLNSLLAIRITLDSIS